MSRGDQETGCAQILAPCTATQDEVAGGVCVADAALAMLLGASDGPHRSEEEQESMADACFLLGVLLEGRLVKEESVLLHARTRAHTRTHAHRLWRVSCCLCGFEVRV